MKKRVFALVLALALCMGLTVPAFAFTTAGRHSTITSNYQYAYIDSNGSLWIWGDNNNGQLGNGQIGESETPVKILDDVISVSTGYGFTGALKSDGSLWMWGENYCGELGNGRKANTVDDMRVPVQTMPIKIMDNVATFSCGAAHAAAVKTDGTLWVWGDNGAYQLGNGGKGNLLEDGWVYQTVPYKLADNVVSVSCGSDFTAFIKSDGSLWGCGTTSLIGVKGAGDYKKPFSGRTYQTVPLKMMDDIKMVSCGHTHMAAIKTDGTLWTWGSNNQGQLGSAVYLLGMYYVEEPQKATIKGDVAFVNAGTDVTAAITTDGTLYMAGSNGAGLLGRGVEDMTSWAFHRVMDDVVSVQCRSIASSGNGNILAVKKDGTLWQWGNNTLVTSEYGRIYRKDALSGSSVPVQTLPLQIPNVTVKVDNLALAGFTVSASTPTIGNFTDVKASDYYADAVLWAVDQKITSGTSSTTFSPGATCSKAQILTFLWRANGSPEPTAANPFTDIKPADYFYKAALWAAEKGLVSGLSGSTFGGNTDCTRAMTVEYLWKLAGSPAPAQQASFTDVPANADYAKAVVWAVDQKITSGTGGGKFSPAATCTRGQIVTFLHRAMA